MKEKSYSKRLEEIKRSNPETLPKRFVDVEKQRDELKKQAKQYLDERNQAESETHKAREEIARLKLQLKYYGQKPLQIEVSHHEQVCDQCRFYIIGGGCSAENNFYGEDCHYEHKREVVYCFLYELQGDELFVLTSDFEEKTFYECEEILVQGKSVYGKEIET